MVSKNANLMEFSSGRWWFYGLAFSCFKNRDAFPFINGFGAGGIRKWVCGDESYKETRNTLKCCTAVPPRGQCLI